MLITSLVQTLSTLRVAILEEGAPGDYNSLSDSIFDVGFCEVVGRTEEL